MRNATEIQRLVQDFVWQEFGEAADRIRVDLVGYFDHAPSQFGYLQEFLHPYGLWFENDSNSEFVISASDPNMQVDIDLLYFVAQLILYIEAKPGDRWSFIHRLGPVMRAARQRLGVTVTALANELPVAGSSVNRWETGASAPTASILYGWLRALGLVCPPKTALVRVVDFSPDLLRFLQEDPTRLRSLPPEQFERFTAERLDRMGYNVTLTGKTNRKDGGIDLIAVPKLASLGSYVIAGQVKHHRGDQTTGVDAVDRLLAWKDSVFRAGLLVTNTSFTNDAIWKAHKDGNAHFLRLRDFIDLKRWLQDQYGEPEDWREIPDQIELAPGVVIEIPRPRITSMFDPDAERSLPDFSGTKSAKPSIQPRQKPRSG